MKQKQGLRSEQGGRAEWGVMRSVAATQKLGSSLRASDWVSAAARPVHPACHTPQYESLGEIILGLSWTPVSAVDIAWHPVHGNAAIVSHSCFGTNYVDIDAHVQHNLHLNQNVYGRRMKQKIV